MLKRTNNNNNNKCLDIMDQHFPNITLGLIIDSAAEMNEN